MDNNPNDSLETLNHWDEFLSHVEQTLGQALGIVEQKEKSLEEVSVQPNEQTQSSSWEQSFNEFQQGMEGLQKLAETAAEKVSHLDTALEEGTEALSQWLSAAELAQEKLTHWLEGLEGIQNK